MSYPALESHGDAAQARCFRQQGDSETRRRANALRQQHEQATEQLRQRLPFRWQVGQVRPRAEVTILYQYGPPAFHIQLLELVTLAEGTKQAQTRAAGDWLCQAALDTETGELRYDTQPAPDYNDGSGSPAASYRPAPTCKRCLRRAEQLYPAP